MRRALAALAWAAWAALACGESQPAPAPGPPEVPPPASGPIALERAFPQLPEIDQPTALLQAPGDPSRWFALEQPGRIVAFDNAPDAAALSPLLDIRHKVVGPDYDWEAGLVGAAFHPDFARNRTVFLFYTTPSETSPVGSAYVVSRFEFAPDASVIRPASEQVVLSRDCGHRSYNGGSLQFGPDGLLYVGLGQNVPSDADPHPSRDPHRWEGTLLRIDVDAARPYAIPPDNPFAAGGGAPEVYAYGFRNPWRFTFDRETGRIFLGDVAERSWEEINLVRPGRNYGWNAVEGDQCASDCPPRYEPPIHAYAGPHSAVIGGYVYRGREIPALRGTYLFADFMRNEVWGLAPAGDAWRAERLLHGMQPLRTPGLIGSITTFAEDAAGELSVVTRGGRIYRIVPRERIEKRMLDALAE